MKFLSNLLFDFSVYLDLNRVIFDSMDSSLSSLFKSITFPNFLPQLIIRFDQILKDISKFPYFSMDLTFIHHYAMQFVIIL